MRLTQKEFVQIHNQAIENNHRYLVILEGARDWIETQLSLIVERVESSLKTQEEPSHFFWLSETPQEHSEKFTQKEWHHLLPAQAFHYLGLESNLLVVQVTKNIPLNAFFALAGTVKGGGGVIWLLPKNYFSTHRLSDQPRFIQYLSSSLDHASLFFYEQQLNQKVIEDNLLKKGSEDQIKKIVPLVRDLSKTSCYHTYLHTEQQEEAVKLIKKVSTGHRLRPLLLSADRGRGKSAALGIAMAELLLEVKETRPLTFVVTAPALINAAVIFKHASNILQCEFKDNKIIFNQHIIEFIPLDQLLAENKTEKKEIHFLCIDEAAAIPMHQLFSLVKQYSRVCLATSIHGYEGTGQGVHQKLRHYLEKTRPEYHYFSMTQSIRWASNDPLEDWLTNTFLLHSTLPEQVLADEQPKETYLAISNQLSTQMVSQDRLLADRPLLKQLFSLLTLAHYRTPRLI